MGDTKRTIVDRLKRADSLTAGDLASELNITEAAVRQHLEGLETRGLVVAEAGVAAGRGRPPTRWRLTDLATDLFPDRHSDLSVNLISAIRSALGEEGLDAVIDARTAAQRVDYSSRVDTEAPVRERVRELARVRSSEGYMAEAVDEPEGATLLVEHHCPICEAASECQGLCRSELDLFRSVLGDDVTVERTQHLLRGDARCVYRIT